MSCLGARHETGVLSRDAQGEACGPSPCGLTQGLSQGGNRRWGEHLVSNWRPSSVSC